MARPPTGDAMKHAEPLPAFLIERHRDWLRRLPDDARTRFRRLAEEGQSPKAMIVTCCDSRVMADDVFGAEAGDFFMHRNIANLVPRYALDGGYRGTSATIEFAVTILEVEHLIVMGHRGCGGVAACLERHGGPDGVPDRPESLVESWLNILAPRVPRVSARKLDPQAAQLALEHETVLLSLENLMTFPFVVEAVSAGRLHLHGLWKDIGDGVLECYDAASGRFAPL
jgi:carbonic anhydrase